MASFTRPFSGGSPSHGLRITRFDDLGECDADSIPGCNDDFTPRDQHVIDKDIDWIRGHVFQLYDGSATEFEELVNTKCCFAQDNGDFDRDGLDS